MGIGRRHTPHAFVQACDKFTFAEVLTSSFLKEPHQTAVKSEITESLTEPREAAAKTNTGARSADRSVDPNLVQRAFLRAVNQDTGQAYLSRFAEALRKLDSTFDHHNFRFHSFRTFCESLKNDYDVVADDRQRLFLVERKSRTDMTTRTSIESNTVRISEASCSPERETERETEKERGREGGKIRPVAFSTDGQLLDNNSVKIWDPASKTRKRAVRGGPVTQVELEKNIRKLKVANTNGKATKEDVQQAVQTFKEFTKKQIGKAQTYTLAAELNKFGDETLGKEHNVVRGAPEVPESALQADGKDLYIYRHTYTIYNG
jgi:hypothetical protein